MSAPRIHIGHRHRTMCGHRGDEYKRLFRGDQVVDLYRFKKATCVACFDGLIQATEAVRACLEGGS